MLVATPWVPAVGRLGFGSRTHLILKPYLARGRSPTAPKRLTGRSQRALETCRSGERRGQETLAEHVRDAQWLVVAQHPVTEGLSRNQPLPQSCYDHIELPPGPHATVLAQAAQSKRPVLVCGPSAKGRYVACGLALGLGADDEDGPPTGPEATLLLNAVRWCGRIGEG